MRSKVSEWLGVATLALVSMYSLATWAQGKITLYIHPRYALFTGIISIIALAMCSLLVVYSRVTSRTHVTYGLATYLVVFVLLLTLAVVPPASLSYKLAQNRGAGSETPATGTKKITLSGATDRFNLEEWSSLISQTADKQKLVGKKADFSGFVIPVEGKENEFLAGKFVVTCCAVDARPVTVRIKYDNWKQKLQADDWVTLAGTTALEDSSIVVMANEVSLISEPKNPYAN